ncbi:MAG: GNAT family N-acetyltransferase [Sphingomonadales bacterium]|nr:GNAT family N-acetyltransferase [Sphingomonadales bacterium]
MNRAARPYSRESMALPAGVLHGARLTLRPPSPDDIGCIMAMDTDAEVMRYIPGYLVTAEREVEYRREKLEELAGSERFKFYYMVTPAGDDTAVGWVLLRPTEDGEWIELGYRFLRSAWGKGYATEASKLALNIAFEDWAVPEVMAVTHPDNLASQHVLTKLGFVYAGLKHIYDFDCAFFVKRR